MSIPDYQTLMLPLLKIASDKKEHLLRDAVSVLSDEFNLLEEERAKLLPSGTQTVIYNRVGWARTYMKKAGLLTIPRKGYFQITERGVELLDKKPEQINVKLLNQFDEFKSFREKHKEKTVAPDTDNFGTPEEALEYGYQKIVENLSEEIIAKLKECSPSFFERLVVDLLVTMG